MSGDIDYKEEIERIEEKLSENPKSRIFLQLAEIYRKRDELDKAIEVLQNGLKVHPDYWTAKVALAKIYVQMEDPEKAIVLLEEVTVKIPDNLLANQLLGDIYYKKKSISEALKYYNNVLNLYPNDEVRAQRVEELMSQKDLDSSPSDDKSENVFETSLEESETTINSELKIEDVIDNSESNDSSSEKDVLDFSNATDLSDIDFSKPLETLDDQENDEDLVEDELITNESFVSDEEDQDSAGIEIQKDFEDTKSDEDFEDEEIPTVTLAQLYFDQGYPDKSIEILENILEKNPQDEKALKFYKKLTESEIHEETETLPVLEDAFVDSTSEEEPFVNVNEEESVMTVSSDIEENIVEKEPGQEETQTVNIDQKEISVEAEDEAEPLSFEEPDLKTANNDVIRDERMELLNKWLKGLN